MANFGCRCRLDCTTLAVIASIVIGILVAFLRITAVITLAPVALIVAFGIAVAYLAVTLLVSAFLRTPDTAECLCPALTAALTGSLGTVLIALVLLAIPFAATSILGAIITGALAAAFTLLLTATACLIRCLTGCAR